jgi:CubicO group peptidase (beta-lactamase class C family)
LLDELLHFHLADQAAFGAPGSALLLMQTGKVLFERYEGTDPLTGRPIGPTDRFNLDSVRKTYLGLALALALLYEGRIPSIDERVARYIPDPAGLLGETRIRHLLTCTHGLHGTPGEPAGLTCPRCAASTIWSLWRCGDEEAGAPRHEGRPST